ncbi:MAG: TatD family hydrolase [Muribaculaceae bacterium]
MLIDTHTHLYLPEFDSPSDAVSRAIDAGVTHMVMPNVDASTIDPLLALAASFPRNISVALGLHPTEVNDDWHAQLDTILARLPEAGPVAIGEVGIDLYWDNTFRDRQREALDAQASIAEQLHLPLIIHCRNGLDDTLDILRLHPSVPVVMHSFCGSDDDIARIRSIGDYYFGINGIVTFKNSDLRDRLPAIGLDRLLLETDSPYLAPVPHRGKRNESAYITHTAAAVARALNTEPEHVAEATAANAARLFALHL